MKAWLLAGRRGFPPVELSFRLHNRRWLLYNSVGYDVGIYICDNIREDGGGGRYIFDSIDFPYLPCHSLFFFASMEIACEEEW
jgi:hypothetical protein